MLEADRWPCHRKAEHVPDLEAGVVVPALVQAWDRAVAKLAKVQAPEIQALVPVPVQRHMVESPAIQVMAAPVAAEEPPRFRECR